MVKVVDSSNNITQYEYDAWGNRNATIYNGQHTEYLIDPFGYGDVIAEYDSNGNAIARYTHGLGLVSRNDGTGNAFYDFDAIGSTVGLTGTAGTNLNSYSYRPFGEDFYERETVANSFEYVGQWGVTEEINGLDFMRSRFYDSRTGRFTSMDTIGLQGRDTNFYRYVGNNPVSFIDPEGTFPVALAVGVGISFLTGSIIGLTACAQGSAVSDLTKFAALGLLSIARAGSPPGSVITLGFLTGIAAGAGLCGSACGGSPTATTRTKRRK